MKKFSFFASLALMAFALVPQTMVADDCQFIPDLFPGQDANRTATEVSATETKDVEDASAEYTTCSSGWLKALPGVLVFDLPAGKGEAEIECEIKAGSKLAVQIEGKGMVAFDTTVEGKIKIAYDNAEQTHVIIYLQDKSGSSSAPKRVANAKQEAPGAAIKSIKITPKGAPTAIENVQTSADKGMKYIQAGQMLILRGDKVYTVTGQEVK